MPISPLATDEISAHLAGARCVLSFGFHQSIRRTHRVFNSSRSTIFLTRSHADRGAAGCESYVQCTELLRGCSAEIRSSVAALGGKPNAAELRRVIVELCRLRWWTPKQLAFVLARRSPTKLTEKHLSPLVNEGRLERRFPHRPNHPEQAYRTRRASESPEETE